MAVPQPSEVADLASITVSSRIPDFWIHQPRVWFIRVEATLAPQKLGDASKFDLVVSKLGNDVVAQISDFLVNPPETNKYEALKKKLLVIYEETKNRQIEKLISEMELGDQKPSQLLRKMKELARDKIPDDTLRVLWQNLLPTTVRALLVVTENKDLEKLATVADDVHEATKSSSIAAVNQPVPGTSTSDNPILAEIAKLSARFERLEKQQNDSNRSRNRSRGRNNASRYRSKSRAGERKPNWLCFYHFRYADKARKCVQPCAWGKKAEN